VPDDRPRDQWQAAIDDVQWYHEFDFGNGLKAIPRIENLDGVRVIWRFIESELARINFSGKSVLDVGAWDGYWSFYAEQRGARSVLATDDSTQNWAGSRGLPVARQLLNSHIEVRQDVSVYDLAQLGRTFDIILFMGVFYHLRDPFYGLAQLRHCCHERTLVVCEGNIAWTGIGTNEMRLLYNPWVELLPSNSALHTLLRSTYFTIESQVWLHPFPSEPSETGPIQSDRALLLCRPFSGVNDLYVYRPHFGLHRYDDRFR
jgi:tRNA (mo5U34)-methyltransferase